MKQPKIIKLKGSSPGLNGQKISIIRAAQMKLGAESSQNQQPIQKSAAKASLSQERHNTITIGDRLHNDIKAHQIAKGQLKNYQVNEYQDQNEASSNGLFNSIQDNEPPEFYRSQRSVAMRIKDTYDNQLHVLENDKLGLIQRLNDTLVQLDKLNQEKTAISNQVIEQTKFVRDLQRETQKGDDLNGVVNGGLRTEYLHEKKMNVQLKEGMKRVEVEKLKVNQRIVKLENEAVQMENDGREMTKELNHKQAIVDDLQKDYEDAVTQIRSAQEERDRLRISIHDTDNQILALREKIQMVDDERINCIDEVLKRQVKFDNVRSTMSHEREKLDIVQDKNIKLRSCIQLVTELDQIMHFNKLAYFNQIKDSSIKLHRNITGLIKMRKCVKQNKSRTLKRYIINWYKSALKPLQNRKQKLQITDTLSKRNPTMHYYYCWQKSFIISRHNKIKLHKAIQQMLEAKENYHARVMKYGFIRWKDQIVNKLDNKKLLLNKVFNKHKTRMSQYFSRWQQVSLELDHQIQLTAMAQRFTANKYLCVLFSNWRAIIQGLKIKRLEDKLRQNNLKKSIFDGFRQNKEEEKTTKLLHQYNEVEIPRKLAAQQTIDEVQQQGNQKHMEYAVKVIAKHLEKRVFQYFETWRKSCVTYQRVLNNQIKLRIINSYNNKLRDAFTKWIAYKGKIMLQQQSQIYQTYQEEISDQNNEIIENQNMLKEKQQKQKTQSGKQMKKIMVGAFQRQLKEKFNQWRRNQEIKLNKQNETQKLVSIMDKQLKRLAFKKYLNKVNENIKDLQNEGKVIQFLRKSSTRSVQKAFYAILGFSSNHYNAKNALGRLIKNLDRSVKENTFKQWIQYKHERQSESLQASQSTTVSQIKNLIDEAGYLQDHVENLNQLNKRSDHTIRQQAKRVIQNSFIRCHELSQRYYFSEWKTKTEKQKQVQLALKKAITHWQRKGQDYSLKLWMRRQAENKQTVLEMAIQQEEQSFSSIQNSSYKSQIKFKNEKDQCVIDLNNLQRDEAELSQKHANCISTIIKRRDNNFYQPKLQYIVQHWREYTASKKRSYQLFEKCMTKSLLEAAFSEIKLVARQNNITNNKSKAANKAINIIYKLKLRSAINQWRSSNHSIVTERQQNAEKQMQNENHKFNMVKDGLQLKLVNNQFNNRQSNILFECYHELKAYSKEQKSIKDKRNQLQQNISKRQLQVGLLKWQQRHQATLKLRQKCKKLQLRLQSLSTKSIFDGWREVFAREKRLCDCIKNIVHRADHIDLQDALGLMKNKYYQYKSYEQRSKGFAKDALQQLINGKELRLQFQAFKKYQYGVQQVNKIISHKRSILIKFLTQRARSYLKVWNDQAQKCAVKEYNNDEGPVRIEIHKLNKELHLLKKALRDEGHKDSDISIVLKSGQDRHTQLIEKAISRMYCYNNDLYLLPWCLDEWKRWLKQRKNYRRAIQLLINRCDYNRSGLGFAFRKWKQQKLQDIKRLQCLQKHQLEKQCIINCDLLEKAATQLENQTFNSEELQDQRNLLLKTFVNSQKLALAVINGGQERIKQRALSRLLTQHHNATKSEYQQVLTFNLDKINQLKEKINMLELSNHGYAEQNEELRVGALDGIDMAQGIEELSKEREKLSIDLADKAIIIRKLLEDNNNLSIRLMNAQEEAEKLIRLSQLKITNNRGYSPSRYND